MFLEDDVTAEDLRWVSIGNVTVEDTNTTVGLSDPCYGQLETLDCPPLKTGNWNWNILTTNDRGEGDVGRVREVSLSHISVPLNMMQVVDPYGRYEDVPVSTFTADNEQWNFSMRGVDAGCVGWELLRDGNVPVDTDFLLEYTFPYQTYNNGNVVVTSSGYGDGLYPVYARVDENGQTVEIRIIFIPFVEPVTPATITRFTELLPGIFPPGKEEYWKVIVNGTVVETVYTERYGDSDNPDAKLAHFENFEIDNIMTVNDAGVWTVFDTQEKFTRLMFARLAENPAVDLTQIFDDEGRETVDGGETIERFRYLVGGFPQGAWKKMFNWKTVGEVETSTAEIGYKRGETRIPVEIVFL